MSSIERYLELAQKVDSFFSRVHRRYSAEMKCATGCADCCRTRLSITGVEAAVIEQFLEGADAGLRARLAERAATGDPSSCVALSAEGLCEIYPARPLVCRSHGAPIRSRADRVSLPVIDCCPLNFAGDVDLDDVESDAVLDQTTLSTVLMAIDMVHADETGRERGARVELAQLVQRYSE